MLRVFRIAVLGVTLISLAACSSIRMKYDSEIQTPEGKNAHFVYEKSYEIPLHPALCGITAIFLGGACWFYLVMPTVHQTELVTNDAQGKLDKKFKSDKYKVTKLSVSRVNWEDQPETNDYKVIEESN